MAGDFIPRHEKSLWGIPCNQRSDGEIFVGKGYGTPFATQIPELTPRVKRALTTNRGDRNGRFWVNRANGTVTMAVGESAANQYLTAPL